MVYAKRNLLAGFTTVRDLGGSHVVISLRNAINKGLVEGPRVFTAGVSIGTTGGHADDSNGINETFKKDLGPEDGVVNGIADAAKAVRQRYKEGSDLIKITATGGVLSGCPASGAASLASCTVLSGAATGNVVITVPISVSSTAISPSLNTVQINGGGSSLCPAAVSCNAEVSSPVLDAVDEAVSKQPQISTSTNVANNDLYPTGSSYTQLSSTCSPIGSMTSAGLASYTTPAANSSCTVSYQVCAPAPNSSVCDSAVLTVNSGNAPQLTIVKSASHSPMVAGVSGQYYSISINVAIISNEVFHRREIYKLDYDLKSCRSLCRSGSRR